MFKKTSILVWVFILTAAIAAYSDTGVQESVTGEPTVAEYNQKGLSHFKKGFYNFAPKLKKKEALQEYAFAIQEYNKALSIEPDYADARRNLARVYYVQKKFLKAVEHYEKLIELDPQDLDLYMLTASAYEKMGSDTEALEWIERAKAMTTDPGAIEIMDRCIKRIKRKKALK